MNSPVSSINDVPQPIPQNDKTGMAREKQAHRQNACPSFAPDWRLLPSSEHTKNFEPSWS